MIVAHIGPPTGRTGGPAGYLHQLKAAATADPSPRHIVRFPSASTGAPRRTTAERPQLGLLTRIRRKLFGPKFYRPPVSEVARAGGVIERMVGDMASDIRQDSRESLVSGLADADIIFTHEPFSAEDAMAQRRTGQQVWMMCHGIVPMVLYLAWSWALPEVDWRELVEYPDVRSWMDWELGIWSRVDRLILPCDEAGDSFRTVDRRFVDVLSHAHHIMSGASTPPSVRLKPDATDIGSVRLQADPTAAGRIGLYLGNPEPYRGFDTLIAGLDLLPADTKLTIAVAGPHPSKVPEHRALRALGRVEDVAGLLASVDFVVNVNRFTLFDLSTIEATEAGKPLLLHAVGGNRAFERIGAGCVMLPDLQPRTIAEGLLRMALMDQSSLVELGRRSRACWEANLTPRHMWTRHLALYDTAR
jgi:glycosyltransferase involved in cell wall biosynthesis